MPFDAAGFVRVNMLWLRSINPRMECVGEWELRAWAGLSIGLAIAAAVGPHVIDGVGMGIACMGRRNCLSVVGGGNYFLFAGCVPCSVISCLDVGGAYECHEPCLMWARGGSGRGKSGASWCAGPLLVEGGQVAFAGPGQV